MSIRKYSPTFRRDHNAIVRDREHNKSTLFVLFVPDDEGIALLRKEGNYVPVETNKCGKRLVYLQGERKKKKATFR
jgi:hypothetical protein